MKLKSPFVPGAIVPFKSSCNSSLDYYVDRKVVLKAKITGYEDEAQTKPVGVMVPQVVEEKTDIKKLVSADAKNVGVANILARVLRTGDMSLLQARDAQYVDTTKLPSSIADVQAKALALESIYANIPGELKKDMSLETFVKTMTDERLKSYYEGQAKQKEASEKKEGE